ncbi:MAG: type II CAAX endopeptidase family protein [Thalassovita sp.]
MPPAYAPHERFIRPARPTAELWRLALGIVMGTVIFAGLQWALLALMFVLLSPDQMMTLQTEIALGHTQMGAVLMLASFGLMLIAVAAVVNQLHRRPVYSLFGNRRLVIWQFGLSLAALALLNLVIWILPPSEFLTAPQPGVPLTDWLRILPLALPALLIQVSAEEVLFRGYLQQQLAARFQSPLIWMVVPSVLFGLLHYRPDLGGTEWLLIGWAVVFGLLAADLTARSGTLGPAIALHLATNASAILFVSADDMLSGLALYRLPNALNDPALLWPYLLIDLGVMLTSWLAVRLALKC